MRRVVPVLMTSHIQTQVISLYDSRDGCFLISAVVFWILWLLFLLINITWRFYTMWSCLMFPYIWQLNGMLTDGRLECLFGTCHIVFGHMSGGLAYLLVVWNHTGLFHSVPSVWSSTHSGKRTWWWITEWLHRSWTIIPKYTKKTLLMIFELSFWLSPQFYYLFLTLSI